MQIIFSILLIVLEVLVLSFMIVKIFTQTKIADIKSTKYFIPTLFINIAVYALALIEAGKTNFFEISVKALEYGTKACFLNVESDLIIGLMNQSALFATVFILSFVVSVFTFVYVFIALTGRALSNFIKTSFIMRSKKEKIVIIGFNFETEEFYKDLPEGKNVLFWEPNSSKQQVKNFLPYKKYNFLFDKMSEKAFKRFNKSQTVFVSFLNNDIQNLELLDLFQRVNSENFKLFVAVDNDCERTFKNAFNAYNINFFNKYSLVAQNFIMQNPITGLIDSKYINTTTATVDDKLNINVFLVGYGNTNKNLFASMMIDNQFLTLKQNKPVHKRVNYYIFDQKERMADKNFSYSTNRFFEVNFNKEDYFELPDDPCNFEFISTDINSKEFYTSIRNILKQNDCNDTFNMVITSVASDLENIDQTMRLKQTFEELNFLNNIFFARIREKSYHAILENNPNVKSFGEYMVLNYDTIVCDKLNRFSIDRHFQFMLKDPEIAETFENFNLIRSVKKQMQEVEKLKLTLWKDLDPIIKDYNKYQSINLRTKLNLIGLDAVGTQQITNKEFYKRYDTRNEIVEKSHQKEYGYPYPKTLQPRNVLSMQEHLHTVAYLISRGILPMTKQEIASLKLNDKTINTRQRVSQDLTAYEDLEKVYELRVKQNKPTKQELIILDNKKNLYQVMDDVPLHKYTNYLIYIRDVN